MFSQKIKNFRLDRNLTQKQLAEMLHLTPNNICEWEKGRSYPSFDVLIKLADLMEVSTDYLLGREADDEKIFTPDTPAPTLPSIERELLTDFRKLPEELRHRASKYMKRLVELYEEESAPKMDALSQKKNTGQFPA